MSNLLGLYFLVLPWVVSSKTIDTFEYPKVVFFVVSINIILLIKIWRVKLVLNFVDKMLLFLLGMQILMWGLNGWLGVSWWGQYFRYQGLITMFSYLSFYFLVSRFGNEKKLHKFIGISAVINSSIILIWGILFEYFHLPVGSFFGRIAGNFGNPNFAAGYLTMIIPYFLFLPNIKSKYKVIASIICMGGLVATQSRSGLVAFMVVMVLYWTKKWKNNLKLITPTLILAVVLTIVFIPRYSPYSNQMSIWKKAIMAIGQRPIIGYGPERFEVAFKNTLIKNVDFDLYNTRVDKAHNEILEIGVSGGIIAMAGYIYLIFWVLNKLNKLKSNPWIGANFLALIVFLIVSQLNVININEYLFFYLVVGATAQKTCV